MAYLDEARVNQLAQWVADKFAKSSDFSTLSDSVDEIEGVISDKASSTNKILSASEIHEMVQRNASAVIGANPQLSSGFQLQSSQFHQILPSLTCLEDGPWYKMHDGEVVECGSTSGVYVEQNDIATVLEDETLFFFYAHNVKYQRVKLGDPTKPWGAITLPDGRQVDVNIDLATMGKPCLWICDDSEYHKNIHGNKSIVLMGFIADIPSKTAVIQEYEDCATISDCVGKSPINRYDLTFPSSIYYCSSSQTDTETPKWGLQYYINNTAFSSEQLAAINSGISVELIAEYNAHIADSDLHVDSDLKQSISDSATKLSTIEEGAQVNVTPDWEAAEGEDGYIANRTHYKNGDEYVKLDSNYIDVDGNTIIINDEGKLSTAEYNGPEYIKGNVIRKPDGSFPASITLKINNTNQSVPVDEEGEWKWEKPDTLTITSLKGLVSFEYSTRASDNNYYISNIEFSPNFDISNISSFEQVFCPNTSNPGINPKMELPKAGTESSIGYVPASNIRSISGLKYWDIAKSGILKMDYLFANLTELTYADIEGWDVTRVTSVLGTFWNTWNLSVNIDQWHFVDLVQSRDAFQASNIINNNFNFNIFSSCVCTDKCSRTFSYLNGVTYLNICGFNLANLTEEGSASRMFADNYALETLVINENFVIKPHYDVSKLFQYDEKLRNIVQAGSRSYISNGINFSDSPLTLDSVKVILNSLEDVSSIDTESAYFSNTITFSKSTWDLIDNDDDIKELIAGCVDKGWNFSHASVDNSNSVNFSVDSDSRLIAKVNNKTVNIGGGADWNASEDEDGYIKNRTHYSSGFEDVTLIDGLIIIDTLDEIFFPDVKCLYSITPGLKYDIIINDTKYENCEVYKNNTTGDIYNYTYYVSNVNPEFDDDSSEYRFAVIEMYGDKLSASFANYNAGDEITLIEHRPIVDKQLYDGFISDNIARTDDIQYSDWLANYSDGKSFIFNRTHFVVPDTTTIATYDVLGSFEEGFVMKPGSAPMTWVVDGKQYFMKLKTSDNRIFNFVAIGHYETHESDGETHILARLEVLQDSTDFDGAIDDFGVGMLIKYEFNGYGEWTVIVNNPIEYPIIGDFTVEISDIIIKKLPSYYIDINKDTNNLIIDEDGKLDVNISVPDWNALETSRSYIKNRTHYIEADSDSIIFSKSDCVFQYDEGTRAILDEVAVSYPDGVSWSNENYDKFYLILEDEALRCIKFESGRGGATATFENGVLYSLNREELILTGVEWSVSVSSVSMCYDPYVKKLNKVYIPDDFATVEYVDLKAGAKYLVKYSESTADTSLMTLQGSKNTDLPEDEQYFGNYNSVLGANSILMSSDKTDINGDYSTVLSSKNISNNGICATVISSDSINVYSDVENSVVLASKNAINTGSKYSAMIGCEYGLFGVYGTAGVVAETHVCNINLGLGLYGTVGTGINTGGGAYAVSGDYNISAASRFKASAYSGASGSVAVRGNFNVFMGNDFSEIYSGSEIGGNNNVIIGNIGGNNNRISTSSSNRIFLFGLKEKNVSISNCNMMFVASNSNVEASYNDGSAIIACSDSTTSMYNANNSIIMSSNYSRIGVTTSSSSNSCNTILSSDSSNSNVSRYSLIASSSGINIGDPDNASYQPYNNAIIAAQSVNILNYSYYNLVASSYGINIGDNGNGPAYYSTYLSSNNVYSDYGSGYVTSIGCENVTLKGSHMTAIGVHGDSDNYVIDYSRFEQFGTVVDTLYAVKKISAPKGTDLNIEAQAYAKPEEDGSTTLIPSNLNLTATGLEAGGEIILTTTGSKSAGKVKFNIGGDDTSKYAGGEFIVNCVPASSGTGGKSSATIKAQTITLLAGTTNKVSVDEEGVTIVGPLKGGFKSLSTTKCTADLVYTPTASISPAVIVIDDTGCTGNYDYTFKGVFTSSANGSLPAATKNSSAITWYGDYGIESGKTYEFNVMKTMGGYIGIVTKLEQ